MSADRAEGIARADRAREELYDTLGQLRERLDYAQRIDDGVARAKQRIAAEKRDNPLVFVAGVVGAAAVTGLVVWGIARKIVRAFD